VWLQRQNRGLQGSVVRVMTQGCRRRVFRRGGPSLGEPFLGISAFQPDVQEIYLGMCLSHSEDGVGVRVDCLYLKNISGDFHMQLGLRTTV
jgi:hypothetical protein